MQPTYPLRKSKLCPLAALCDVPGGTRRQRDVSSENQQTVAPPKAQLKVCVCETFIE